MSVIRKFKNKAGYFNWEGAVSTTYPNNQAQDVTKQILIGANDQAQNFAVRYFELAAGGFTSLDQHKHDHGVIVVRGKGRVLLDNQKFAVEFGDVIYISPNDVHQFENNSDEPFGFICIIPPKD